MNSGQVRIWKDDVVINYNTRMWSKVFFPGAKNFFPSDLRAKKALPELLLKTYQVVVFNNTYSEIISKHTYA
jgi:hypothetical protein